MHGAFAQGAAMSEWRQYRVQARSFERPTAAASRVEAREELLALARQWEQLADKSELAERRDRPSGRTTR